MDKLEKVIKWLEHCTSYGSTCDKCDYWEHNRNEDDPHCGDVLMREAIELLKEQNSLMLALDQSNSANEYLNEEVDKLNALLRQQQDEIAMMTKKEKSPTWR